MAPVKKVHSCLYEKLSFDNWKDEEKHENSLK